jgi:hypothetical protein
MADHELGTAGHPCPECGLLLDCATNVEPGVTSSPSPGDMTVCLGCASPLVFGPELELRHATLAELNAAPRMMLVAIKAASAANLRSRIKDGKLTP